MSRMRMLILSMFVLIGLLFLKTGGFLDPIIHITEYASRPFQHVLFNWNIRISTGSLTNNEEVSRLSMLEDQLRSALVKISNDSSLVRENEELRAALRLENRIEYDSVAAQVMGSNDYGGVKTLLVDRGSRDGVRLKAPVLINEGVLLGTIIEVREDSSNVLLTTDRQSQVLARRSVDEKTSGIAQGERGEGLRMDLIPKDISISNGDVVVTAATPNGIPEGFVLGTVAEVQDSASGIFKSALLDKPYNEASIHIVSIIIQSRQGN